jgi:hypothetical protein
LIAREAQSASVSRNIAPAASAAAHQNHSICLSPPLEADLSSAALAAAIFPLPSPAAVVAGLQKIPAPSPFVVAAHGGSGSQHNRQADPLPPLSSSLSSSISSAAAGASAGAGAGAAAGAGVSNASSPSSSAARSSPSTGARSGGGGVGVGAAATVGSDRASAVPAFGLGLHPLDRIGQQMHASSHASSSSSSSSPPSHQQSSRRSSQQSANAQVQAQAQAQALEASGAHAADQVTPLLASSSRPVSQRVLSYHAVAPASSPVAERAADGAAVVGAAATALRHPPNSGSQYSGARPASNGGVGSARRSADKIAVFSMSNESPALRPCTVRFFFHFIHSLLSLSSRSFSPRQG